MFDTTNYEPIKIPGKNWSEVTPISLLSDFEEKKRVGRVYLDAFFSFLVFSRCKHDLRDQNNNSWF